MFVRPRSQDPDRRRRWLIGVAVVLAIAFVVSGVYAALSDRSGLSSRSAPASTSVQDRSEGAPARPADVLDPITRTEKPEEFATDVARALFEWDTDSPIPLDNYAGRILAIAEPTGDESPGLVTDVTAYLPTASIWAELRPYRTRQWLEIESVSVPSTWSEVSADSETYHVAAGTTAYTITGVRHRAGVWDNEAVETSHDVSFTVFAACQPTYKTCYLLRLSKLDEPLP